MTGVRLKAPPRRGFNVVTFAYPRTGPALRKCKIHQVKQELVLIVSPARLVSEERRLRISRPQQKAQEITVGDYAKSQGRSSVFEHRSPTQLLAARIFSFRRDE